MWSICVAAKTPGKTTKPSWAIFAGQSFFLGDMRKDSNNMITNSKTKRTFQQLSERLLEILPARPEEMTPSARFDELIPPNDRRRVWEQLRDTGFDLPQLTLSGRGFLAAAFIVLAPVALLAYLFDWSFVFSVAELGILARKITRPLAIHPPIGCETMQEAALQLTPFRHEDYKAGLWPREDIAAKVRWVVSYSLRMPFEEVTEETSLANLC
jgi:hypothetical protein